MAEPIEVRRTGTQSSPRAAANSPDAVRAEIRRTRERMDTTLDELTYRLDPDHVKHELGARVRGEVTRKKNQAEAMMHDAETQMNKAGHTLADTIRKNPVPAAMVGIGVGWLVKNGRGASGEHDGYGARERARMPRERVEPRPVGGAAVYEEDISVRSVPVESDRSAAEKTGEPTAGEQAKHKAAETGERAKQKAEGAAHKAGQKVGQAQHMAREKAGKAQHMAREKAGKAQHMAREKVGQAQHMARAKAGQAERTVNENPLAAGAAALALGFAVGTAIPESRREDRMMGPARDRFMDRAEQKGEQVKQKAKHVAEAAAEEAKTTAKEQAKREGMSA